MASIKLGPKSGDDTYDTGTTLDESDINLSEGTMALGNSSGVGTEIDIGNTDKGFLIGNGTTATVAAFSGDVTTTNAGVATVAALDLESATVTNIADTEIMVGDGAASAAFVTVSGDATLANTGALTIANDAVNEAKTADSDGTGGLYVQKCALAVYDFAVDGGTAGTITLSDTATLPDNAVVTGVTHDVITTCTSSSDAATIALQVPTDGALTTAIAISDGTNPWDAGAHLVNTALPKKLTAARALEIVVAGGENITAGKIVFAVQYYVSQ